MSNVKGDVKGVVDLSKYLNVYNFSTVLPGSGETVKFKPISTFQLKELISYDGDGDEALDNLINSCVTTEGFDVKNLSLQDRFFLLVELRKKSKGSKYALSYSCNSCHGQVLDSLNLDKLKVKKLGDLDYTIKLDDNISVTVKLLTRSIRIAAAEKVKQLIASGKYKEEDKLVDEAIMSYLMCVTSIVTPGGVIDNPELEQLIFLFSQAPASFYDTMVKWFDDLDFGVEFKTELTCKHCKHKEKIEIPLESFFA